MPNNTLVVTGNKLDFNGKIYDCAIGKAGFSANKKEGDNCTPIGTFQLREVLYRADKIQAPKTALPLRIVTQQDGWCDDVTSADYNKPIHLPHPARYEKLWRNDGLYDLIISLGYNDDPVIPGKGSAIFMHIAKPEYAGTEGCVALKKEDLLAVLQHCDTHSIIDIRKA